MRPHRTSAIIAFFLEIMLYPTVQTKAWPWNSICAQVPVYIKLCWCKYQRKWPLEFLFCDKRSCMCVSLSVSLWLAIVFSSADRKVALVQSCVRLTNQWQDIAQGRLRRGMGVLTLAYPVNHLGSRRWALTHFFCCGHKCTVIWMLRIARI